MSTKRSPELAKQSRNEQLTRENKELRARLAEAEETLRAVQSGDVDAVIASGPEGDRVFTLKGAEYAYRSLVEAMNEGAATISPNGTVLYCNRKFASLLQLPQEKVIGTSASSLISCPDQGTFATALSSALSGSVATAEIQLLTQDGCAAPAYISLSLLEVNETPAACMVVTDLADHKQREKLIAAGNLARSLLEHATEAIAVCDQDGRIVMANEALRQLSGRDPLWQSLDEVLPLEIVTENPGGEDRIRPFSVASALRGNRFKAEEVVYRRNDEYSRESRMQWLLLTSGPTMIGTQAVGCVITLLDITERKMAEKVLMRTEKLAATGQLAASIAHEINNPLAAIHNLLYLIEHEADPVKAQTYAKTANEELSRVAHITKQTLAFYRDLTNPESIRISQIVDEVLALYGRELGERRVRVNKRYDVPGDLKGFPGEMRQVFSNLIRNAIQAMPETDGMLHLHIRGARRDGKDGVVIYFADNGCGIHPSLQHRIFEPFFTTKGQKGTGLGLWVARDLVLKHGGSIRVRSSRLPERSGTCFQIFLPLPKENLST